MPIRHLAFDLDETLIDTRDQIVESIMACLAREQRTKNTRSRLHRDAHRSPKAILGEFGIASLKAYWRHQRPRVSRVLEALEGKSSDARGKAHVHVIILGLDRREDVRTEKGLFGYPDINGERFSCMGAV